IGKIVFAPGGKTLAWTTHGNRIRLTNVPTGKELLAGSGQAAPAHLTVSPDGKMLAAPCARRRVGPWDAGRGKEVRAWKGPDGPHNLLRFTPDGKVLITLGKKLQHWDVATGAARAQFDAAPGPHLLGPWAVSPDATVLAVGPVNMRG